MVASNVSEVVVGILAVEKTKLLKRFEPVLVPSLQEEHEDGQAGVSLYLSHFTGARRTASSKFLGFKQP